MLTRFLSVKLVGAAAKRSVKKGPGGSAGLAAACRQGAADGRHRSGHPHNAFTELTRGGALAGTANGVLQAVNTYEHHKGVVAENGPNGTA